MKDTFQAFDAGVGAARRGVPESDCPFDPHERASYAAWRKGHLEETTRMEAAQDDKHAQLHAAQEKQDRARRPLLLMHEPVPLHLRKVIGEMRELGPPTITCLFTDAALYALEGVHRLTACSKQFLQFGATLNCVETLSLEETDRLFDDKAYQFLWGFTDSNDIIEAVKQQFPRGWDTTYQTYRSQVPGRGVHKRVQVFGATSAWSMRISKDDPLLKLEPEDRIRVKEWSQSPETGNYYTKAGSFTATVFHRPEGWKIRIAVTYDGQTEWGTIVYATAEEAMANAWKGVKSLRLLRRRNRINGGLSNAK